MDAVPEAQGGTGEAGALVVEFFAKLPDGRCAMLRTQGCQRYEDFVTADLQVGGALKGGGQEFSSFLSSSLVVRLECCEDCRFSLVSYHLEYVREALGFYSEL